MITTLSVDRFDAKVPRWKPGTVYRCPNCQTGAVSVPDVVCTKCQAEPTFSAAVEAFNARQAAREAQS